MKRKDIYMVCYQEPVPGGAKPPSSSVPPAASAVVGPASTSPDDPTRQVFDGFPYLVARLRSAVFLVQPVPAALSREELIVLARKQAEESGLSTCLAFGLRDGVYCEPGGSVEARDGIPRGGRQLFGQLVPGPELPSDEDVEAREKRLEAYLVERKLRVRGG